MGADKLAVYQIHIVLREISPTIWRRVLVRSDSTIADLRYTIQIAMGWSDTHLNRFYIHGKDYGVYHDGGMTFADRADKVMLSDFPFCERERFLYEYDFGDLWQHDVRVEKILPLEPKRTYPMCMGGRRRCPPEDCGGPWTFMENEQYHSPMMVIDDLLDIEDDDPQDYLEQVEDKIRQYNDDRFDRRAVNRRLEQYASGDDAWLWETL